MAALAHELMHGLAVFTQGEAPADNIDEERVAEIGSATLCSLMGWQANSWYLEELGSPTVENYEEVGRRLLYLAQHVDIV